jgi:hypothetical protein
VLTAHSSQLKTHNSKLTTSLFISQSVAYRSLNHGSAEFE